MQNADKSVQRKHRGVCHDTDVSTPAALATRSASGHLEISADAAEDAQPAFLVAGAQSQSLSIDVPVSQAVASH